MYLPINTKIFLEWRKADNASDTEDTSAIIEPEYETDSFGESDEEEIPIERPTLFTREKTAISLADFYAPSPSPTGPGNIYHKQ